MDTLKQARKLCGWTEEAASVIAGVSRPKYRRFEAAPWTMTFEHYYRLYQEMDEAEARCLMDELAEQINQKFLAA